MFMLSPPPILDRSIWPISKRSRTRIDPADTFTSPSMRFRCRSVQVAAYAMITALAGGIVFAIDVAGDVDPLRQSKCVVAIDLNAAVDGNSPPAEVTPVEHRADRSFLSA